MKLKKSGKGTEQYMKPTMEIIEISDNMITTSGTGTSCFPDTSPGCSTDTKPCSNNCWPYACTDIEDTLVGF